MTKITPEIDFPRDIFCEKNALKKVVHFIKNIISLGKSPLSPLQYDLHLIRGICKISPRNWKRKNLIKTHHSDKTGKVNMGKMEMRNKLSKVAKPHKISTNDFFNLTSLWLRTRIVKVLAITPNNEIWGTIIPSTMYLKRVIVIILTRTNRVKRSRPWELDWSWRESDGREDFSNICFALVFDEKSWKIIEKSCVWISNLSFVFTWKFCRLKLKLFDMYPRAKYVQVGC